MAADDREPQINELVDARLQRAAKRLQERDYVRALDDLHALLRHLRRIGANPHVLRSLTNIIEGEEQGSGERSSE